MDNGHSLLLVFYEMQNLSATYIQSNITGAYINWKFNNQAQHILHNNINFPQYKQYVCAYSNPASQQYVG